MADKYENKVIEPFTVRTLNGARFYRCSHNSNHWYVDGYINSPNVYVRDRQKSQRKLSIDDFLYEIPDLCYAPLDEDAQETLVLYLDTDWISERIYEITTEKDKGWEDEIKLLAGTARILRRTAERLIEIATDESITCDWLSKLEAKLQEQQPGMVRLFPEDEGETLVTVEGPDGTRALSAYPDDTDTVIEDKP